MEFKSLNDLVRVVENGLAVQFYGSSSSVLRKGVLKVLAYVLGGALYLFSLVAKRIWRNRFISTCDDSALDGFGDEYGIPHKPEQKAKGYAAVTLASGVSSVEIPEGTYLVDVGGLEFVTDSTTTITSSSNLLSVTANKAGEVYNLIDGETLEFRDGDVDGVEKMVAQSIEGGESIEVLIDGNVQLWGETALEYRNRLLNRVRNQPHGGTKNDYWQWAMSFAPVTDCFVFKNAPNSNSVSVVVANYNDDDFSISQDVLGSISNYINDDSRRPITADVRVFGVTPVELKLKASVVPYSSASRESVIYAIKSFFRKMEPGTSISKENLSVEIRSNSSVSSLVFVEARVKQGGQWNIVDSIQMAFDPSNEIAQMVKIVDENIELVSGE
jgi:uncharacterized phage protein gp47/JayE